MKCKLRLPFDFKEFQGDTIISNFDNSINAEIEKAIKGKQLFSRYSARHFNGKIWWNDEIGYWCGEVWVYQNYIDSYLATTLESLAMEMDTDYGKGE